MRERVVELLVQGRPDAAAALAAASRGGVRALTARLWDLDQEVRQSAAEAIGHLADLAPAKLLEVLRRFVWALNDESGTNGAATLTAMAAVARHRPAALAPFLGALVALLDDDGLRPGIVTVLDTVARTAPELLAVFRADLIGWGDALEDNRLAALAARLQRGDDT